MTAAKKPKEFGLSDEVPEAVVETELARAEKAWQARSDSAAEAVKLPAAPYRIRGDEEAQAWFVEEAVVERSDMPGMPYDLYGAWRMMALYHTMDGRLLKAPEIDYAPYIAKIARDRPKAKLVWKKIGRRTRGFFTYAKAAKWLREYLEPVREESVYFTSEGREA
jgi:hypothetical protein